MATQYFSSITTDPFRAFRYTATFTSSDGTYFAGATGLDFKAGFTNITGLQITTQNIEYREGGMNTTVHQVPGLTTFQPIVFTRGTIAGNDQAMTWMRGLFGAASGQGISIGANAGFRMNVTIAVNAHPSPSDTASPVIAFQIRNAWITNLNYSDLDAASNAILFERMTLIHEGLSVTLTDPTNATPTPATGATGVKVITL